MADPGIKVHVQTTADTSGLNSAASGLEKLKGSGESVSRVSERLGKIFKIMFDPISIGVGLAYVAISTLHRKIQEFHAAMEPAKWQGSKEVWEEYAKALYQSDMAAAKFGRELLALQNTTESTANATARLLELTRNYARLQGELDNKRKAVDIAKVDAMERQRAITPEEAVQRRADIEDRYERERLAREEANARREIQIKEQERQEIEAGLPGKLTELRALTRERDLLGSDAMDQKALARVRSNAQAARQKSGEMAGQAYGLVSTMLDVASPGFTRRSLIDQERGAESEEARAAEIEALVKSRAMQRAGLEARIGQLEGEVKSLTKRRGDLGIETDQGYRILNQNLIAANQGQALDTESRALTGQVARMPAVADRRLMTAEVQQGLAAGAGVQGSRLDDVAQRLASNNIAETMAQYEAAAQAMNQLLGLIGQSQVNGEELRRRVAQLEEQMKHNR